VSLTIPQQLRKHARNRPGKIALIDRDREFTFATLDRMVDGAAHAMAGAGIAFGMLVGVALKDRAEHLVALLALGRIGAIVLPLDPRWNVAEIDDVARNFGAALVLCEETHERSNWRRFDDGWCAPSDRPYDDSAVSLETPMILSLSSGTTGMPKGPLATHGKFIARFQLYWIDLALNARDRFVTATPLYYGGGRGFALAMIYAGGTAVLFCPPYKPRELVDYVAQVGGTAMFLVPTLLRRLSAEPGHELLFPTLRVLISSGAAIHASEQALVRDRLSPHLFQYYSSTEGGGCTLLAPEDFAAHPDSVGQPCFGVKVEVVDEADQPLLAGDVGRLRYRSAASADSYYRSDDTAAFRDGWFYPGDLGAFDGEGFLKLLGRAKDMIIRGGVNIYPGDIEATITAVPGVAEAAVVGLPSPDLGEEVVAIVVRREGGDVSAEALRAACAERLAPYKVPSRFVFVDDLPRSGIGKVNKRELIEILSVSARSAQRGA